MKGKVLIVAIIIASAFVIGTGLLSADSQPEESFFTKSLHHTGHGMRYWYERPEGLIQLTGIPYDSLGCKNCHVKTCDTCHAVEKDGSMVFSTEKARELETCLACHVREAASMKFDKKAGADDVHFAAGMRCADCHEGEDVHGDGNKYESLHQENAIKSKCENCHTPDGDEAPAFTKDIKAHQVHETNLDCSACHVQSTMACLNCHFGEFLKTGEKKGNFIPSKEWLLLINCQGKIKSATAMTFVHRDPNDNNAKAEPFVMYSPYFTHSISKKGRDCDACHGTNTVEQIQKGQKIKVTTYKDGKFEALKGIIPTVPDSLKWEFLDKVSGKWCVLPVKDPVKHQMACYGTALSKEQLEKLAKPQQTDKKN